MLKAVVVACAKVQTDNVALQALTALRKGLLIGGTQRKQITLFLELGEAEILRKVTDDDSCPPEDTDVLRELEWQRVWNW